MKKLLIGISLVVIASAAGLGAWLAFKPMPDMTPQQGIAYVVSHADSPYLHNRGYAATALGFVCLSPQHPEDADLAGATPADYRMLAEVAVHSFCKNRG